MLWFQLANIVTVCVVGVAGLSVSLVDGIVSEVQTHHAVAESNRASLPPPKPGIPD